MKLVLDEDAPASAASSGPVPAFAAVHKGDFGSLIGGNGFFNRKTVKHTSCLQLER